MEVDLPIPAEGLAFSRARRPAYFFYRAFVSPPAFTRLSISFSYQTAASVQLDLFAKATSSYHFVRLYDDARMNHVIKRGSRTTSSQIAPSF